MASKEVAATWANMALLVFTAFKTWSGETMAWFMMNPFKREKSEKLGVLVATQNRKFPALTT
jgi:hypothetical protein